MTKYYTPEKPKTIEDRYCDTVKLRNEAFINGNEKERMHLESLCMGVRLAYETILSRNAGRLLAIADIEMEKFYGTVNMCGGMLNSVESLHPIAPLPQKLTALREQQYADRVATLRLVKLHGQKGAAFRLGITCAAVSTRVARAKMDAETDEKTIAKHTAAALVRSERAKQKRIAEAARKARIAKGLQQ